MSVISLRQHHCITTTSLYTYIYEVEEELKYVRLVVAAFVKLHFAAYVAARLNT